MSLPTEKPSNTAESGQKVYALIQNLSRIARHAEDPRNVCVELIQALGQLVPLAAVRIWLGSRIDHLREYAGPELPLIDGPITGELHEQLNSVLSDRSARMFPTHFESRSTATTEAHSSVLVPVTAAERIYGVVCCELNSQLSPDVLSQVCRLALAVVESILPFFESQRIHQLLAEQQFDRRYEQFVNEINTDPAMSSTPATIATEYQRLFTCDRTWVLLPSGRQYRVKSVGGIPGFQRRAEVVRRLQALVQLVCRTRQPFFWAAGQSTDRMSGRMRKILDQYVDESHVATIRIEPLLKPQAQKISDVDRLRIPVIGVIVCEWFQTVPDLDSESRWNVSREAAELALQNASDWSRAPVARLLRTVRRTRSWFRVGGWSLLLIAIATGLGLASLVSIDFTIDAKGELHSTNRRHVFATTSGIVRQVAVKSGDTVVEGQVLLELDSPDLELEIRRAEGNLQTTEKKIKSVEASRLDFSFQNSDSPSQLNSLASELKELKQVQINLTHEIELLVTRRKELQVLSPINGRVVTWDAERLLSRRPVVQGQRLMTISDADAAWDLELLVPDRDLSDLNRARQQSSPVRVDFIMITMPERVYTAQLKSVAETVEVHSAADGPALLCLAEVPDELVESAVEGMSVRGRIHCGNRPIYRVLFDKMWRVLKEQILFPIGW